MAIRYSQAREVERPCEGLAPPPGAQERLLDQVLGLLERAQHPVAVELQLAPVAGGERLEGGPVVELDGGHGRMTVAAPGNHHKSGVKGTVSGRQPPTRKSAPHEAVPHTESPREPRPCRPDAPAPGPSRRARCARRCCCRSCWPRTAASPPHRHGQGAARPRTSDMTDVMDDARPLRDDRRRRRPARPAPDPRHPAGRQHDRHRRGLRPAARRSSWRSSTAPTWS